MNGVVKLNYMLYETGNKLDSPVVLRANDSHKIRLDQFFDGPNISYAVQVKEGSEHIKSKLLNSANLMIEFEEQNLSRDIIFSYIISS